MSHPVKELLDRDWLYERYTVQGATIYTIAAAVGCSGVTVNTALARHGIERRRRCHGQSNSPSWNSWRSMHKRCLDPVQRSWPDYGGRGITICEQWLLPDGRGFLNFLSDMGERPPGLTLDRIDNDGNYEPGNCRWATPSEQRRNQRKAKEQ